MEGNFNRFATWLKDFTTGKVTKWVPISEVAQEVQKLQEIADWTNTLRDISITNVPTLPANQDDLNIPPNINI